MAEKVIVLDRDHAFEFKLDDEAAQEQVIRGAKKYGMAVLKPKTDYISREAAKEAVVKAVGKGHSPFNAIVMLPAADVRPVPEGGIGEMSDGYHTFNGLYYQRMVLFAALVKAHKDKAWKSWKHEDGEFCFGGGWFIVGIDTPAGSFTYHYDKMYWNLFECKELPTAKHWDGHTEKDVTRLLSLDARPVVLCRDCKYWKQWDNTTHYLCTYVAGAKFIRNAEDFCSRGEKREES